jgi:hypothetical protein
LYGIFLTYSIAGSLGGQLLVILPILLNGMLYVTASQVGVVVNIELQRNSGRKLFANIQSCQPQLSYISATLVDGGPIGDSINNVFKVGDNDCIFAQLFLATNDRSGTTNVEQSIMCKNARINRCTSE